jgi:hypothetical protein
MHLFNTINKLGCSFLSCDTNYKKLFFVTGFCQNSVPGRLQGSDSSEIRMEHDGPVTACALYSRGQHINILSNHKAACFD